MRFAAFLLIGAVPLGALIYGYGHRTPPPPANTQASFDIKLMGDLQKTIDLLAKKGGGTIYVPAGIYEGRIVLKDRVNLVGDGATRTILKYTSNAIGEGFTDDGHPVHCIISDLALIRAGNGNPVVNAGQDNRYTLHIFGLGSLITLNNVLLTEENWNLGPDRQTDWAGLIAIVNETGVLNAADCSIKTRGRGLYQPSNINKPNPIIYWNGTINTGHKAISLHTGAIHGKGNVTCNIPGKGAAACFSTYSGSLLWQGNTDFHGRGPAIFNVHDAIVNIQGNIVSTGNGIDNRGIGLVVFSGDMRCGAVGIYHTGTGSVTFDGSLTTAGTGIKLFNGVVRVCKKFCVNGPITFPA